MVHVYLFEARGIQRFLFASGRLRDVLAGSELLDYVCADDGLLDRTLDALKLQPSVVPRRAGATFYLVFTDAALATRFRAAWRLAFAQWVPGVEGVDALVHGEGVQNTIGVGIDALSHCRNQLRADLPCPGPLTELSPRTGMAAVARDREESLDRGIARLRHFQRPDGGVTLERRFLDDSNYHWPRNFEASGPLTERFPLLRDRMVGVIHADGNGIGQVLRTLNRATERADDGVYASVYRGFSELLARTTQNAARAASRETLVPHATGDAGVLPARPLVLGGDDLSILVRADLAVAYTESFLRAFAEQSRAEMRKLRGLLEHSGLADGAWQLPEQLTASAGICYVKCSYPFEAAYALAESLCKRAKDAARSGVAQGSPPPSALAFHKMEGAVVESGDALFERFHRVHANGSEYELALPAYTLNGAEGLPGLADLRALAGVFAGLGRLNDRPLRKLATLWRQDPGVARQSYARWRQISGREHGARLRSFDDALARLVGATQRELPASQGQPARSPLSDLITWLSIHSTGEAEVAR